MDFEVMYQAMDSRDRRFDGRFFVAVKTTGVYCRPICPAPTPKRQNTRFFRYAAVAELAGFRPCKRCRPEVSPDTAEWDTRADLVGRGLRLVADGFVDEAGVSGLATRLGVSERHLQRVFTEEVGATPGAIARSRRARLARQLLTETAMPITRVAYASGFGSVRAFNETIRSIYDVTPTGLRRGAISANGSLRLDLRYRAPFAGGALLSYLSTRAIPGVEHVSEGVYRRSIGFGERGAVLALDLGSDAVRLTIESDEIDQLAPVVQRSRRLLDLDADPAVIEERLERSPALRPLLAARPGIRLPGSYEPFEVAVVAVLEQRTSAAAAATTAGTLARALGAPLEYPSPPISHRFPSPEQLATADLRAVGIPAGKASTIRSLAAALCDGVLAFDGSIEPDEARHRLRAIEGLGEHTISRISLRTLRDPDAFPAQDAAVRRFVASASQTRAHEWQPWRGYAAMHIWAESGAAGEPDLG